MADQITCVTKTGWYNHHESIARVGGVRKNGQPFNITREECASDILDKRSSYEIVVGGVRTLVRAYIRDGNKYITTRPDQTTDNNLSSLQGC
jgi:Protein of unknown function (DUF3892)